jgi:ferredoxin-NADP reductase
MSDRFSESDADFEIVEGRSYDHLVGSLGHDNPRIGFASEVSHDVGARHRFADAVITKVVRETRCTRSFEFVITNDTATFCPRPGQFASIRFIVNGQPHERFYAISSLVARGDAPRFTVRRVRSGLISNWCHDQLKEDARIEIGPAQGSFQLLPGRAPIIFLAAGIGIAPIFPLCKEALMYGGRRIRMVVIDRARSNAVFAEQLRGLATWCGDRFELSEKFTGSRAASAKMIAAQFAGLAWADLYICGPAGFIDTAIDAAIRTGIARDRIFINDRDAIEASLNL